MCGLVGIFGAPSLLMLKAFKQLLVVDQLRGTDSTGTFFVKEDYKWGIIKDVGPPENILSGADWRKNLWSGTTDADNILLMGHNRAKTFGAVTAENAHPFKHGNIVLAHNGTLWDTRKLKVETENFAVDSEHLCYHLNKKGVDETWKQLFGAAALTYYDMRSRDLHLIRNDQRPLQYAWGKGRKNIFWASEAWMLRAVLARNKLEIEDDKVFTINPHYLHTFKWSPKTKVVSHSFRKLDEAKYVPIVQNTTQHNWNWQDEYDAPYGVGRAVYKEGTNLVDATGRTIPPGPTSNVTSLIERRRQAQLSEEKKNEEYEEIAQLLGRYKTRTAEEFRDLHLSCTLCNTPLASDFKESVLLDPNTGVCPSCFANAENLVLSTVTVH